MEDGSRIVWHESWRFARPIDKIELLPEYIAYPKGNNYDGGEGNIVIKDRVSEQIALLTHAVNKLINK